MTIEEMAKQEIERNRAFVEFNRAIAREIWGINNENA